MIIFHNPHWWFISASWLAVLGGFALLGLAAALRHRRARRQLARLEAAPRQRPAGGGA